MPPASPFALGASSPHFGNRLSLSLKLGCALGWLASSAIAAPSATTPAPVQETRDYLYAPKGAAEWFRDAKFGMMICMGPCNVLDKEGSWSRGGARPGTAGKAPLRPHGNYVPVDVYDNLYKRYNPAKADANQWVQIVKDAGAQYLVFLTKHHDGFDNFDSKLTDYKITSPLSPYGRDLTKQVADACHAAGLRLGFYYSEPDWHHPDAFTAHHANYIKYLHGQVSELLSNYGKVDIIWFDGLYGTAKDWDSDGLLKMIRRLQPDILINNRIEFPYGATGLWGDFDTPEGHIGDFQSGRPWETCMPIGHGWYYNSKDVMVSLEQLKKILLSVVGSDGNFLLDVGPMPDGQIDPAEVARLKDLGQWVHQYGESIYGTRGGPYKPSLWGVSTYKDNTVYLHIMDWDEPVRFPLKDAKIVSSAVLTGGAVKVEQTGDYFTVDVAPEHRDQIDTIVRLQLSSPASQIAPCNAQYANLAPHQSISSFPKASPKYAETGPDKALDNDYSTHWETPPHGWLEIDLGQPVSIDRIAISEGRPAARSAVKQFEVLYKNKSDEPWQTLTKGQQIGFDYTKSFKPVTARSVRLNLITSGRVVIKEFFIFKTPEAAASAQTSSP